VDCVQLAAAVDPASLLAGGRWFFRASGPAPQQGFQILSQVVHPVGETLVDFRRQRLLRPPLGDGQPDFGQPFLHDGDLRLLY
jgi:hypothetical protein